jgi:hypothetical protein
MCSLQRIFGGSSGKMTKAQGDQAVIEQLRALGADLNQPRELIHYLYLPAPEVSRQAAKALRSRGYSTEERAAANANENPPNPFLVMATSQTVLNPRTLQEFRQLFEQLAAFHNGEYDGWEAAAQP